MTPELGNTDASRSLPSFSLHLKKKKKKFIWLCRALGAAWEKKKKKKNDPEKLLAMVKFMAEDNISCISSFSHLSES